MGKSLDQAAYFVVEERGNPSSDYFVRPELAKQGASCKCFRLSESPEQLQSVNQPTLLFVRYINRRWRRWVEQHNDQISRPIIFMDDDLFDMQAHQQLPLRYRWKLYRLALRHKAWLKSINAQLWVSTPWLAEKYADWNPRLLKAHSPYIDISQQKTIFYHGSASHNDDIRWLLPIIRAALAQDSSLSFEIIGDAQVRSLFAKLPRVHVVHPMQWPAYQAFVSRPGRSIGLAPLVDNAFNRARAPSKFFDITQAGAVGIYADHPVYRPVVKHQQNGLLLPMTQSAWIDAILTLSSDDELRERLLKGARESL